MKDGAGSRPRPAAPGLRCRRVRRQRGVRRRRRRGGRPRRPPPRCLRGMPDPRRHAGSDAHDRHAARGAPPCGGWTSSTSTSREEAAVAERAERAPRDDAARAPGHRVRLHGRPALAPRGLLLLRGHSPEPAASRVSRQGPGARARSDRRGQRDARSISRAPGHLRGRPSARDAAGRARRRARS